MQRHVRANAPKNQIDKADPDSFRLVGAAGDALWYNGGPGLFKARAAT
jgi:hypothetical protein